MALPSQTARASSGGRSNMASRHRRNLRPAIAVGSVVALAGVVGAYALWHGPSAADAKPSTRHADADTRLSDSGPADGSTRGEPAQAQSNPPAVIIPPAASLSPGPSPAHPDPETDVPDPAPVEAPKRDPAPPPPPAPARVVEDYPADLQGKIRAAEQKIDANDLVTARDLLNRALHSDKATEADRDSLRTRITKLNDDLVFSPNLYKDDPLTEVYTVQGGDTLGRIIPREGLAVESGFIARVNHMSNPNNLRVGQKLKLVRGPFHAVISKSAFRIDLYWGNPGEESDWVYIRSFPVGLGEGDSTPVGTFVVRRNSKLINPPWMNPRTHERFAANDPKNPIGERWLGLEGTGASAAHSGYGIHGTVDPDSIGQMRSMGCVRLRSEDVEVVYDMLVEAISQVRIEP